MSGKDLLLAIRSLGWCLRFMFTKHDPEWEFNPKPRRGKAKND